MNNPHFALFIQQQAARFNTKVALRYKDYGLRNWLPVTWRELNDKVTRLSLAMARLGLEPEQKAVLFSQNCPEYLYAEFALFRNRAVSVPVYATSGVLALTYILQDSEARFLFVDGQYQYEVAIQSCKENQLIEKIILFDSSVQLVEGDEKSIFLDDLLHRPVGETEWKPLVEQRSAEALLTDLATIIYTSGTTGEPKGAMLTHASFHAAIRANIESLPPFTEKEVALSFLPLAHIFEKMWVYLCLYVGCEICFNKRAADFQRSLKEIRPTVMCCVPRFWEKIYAEVLARIELMDGWKKRMVKDALKTGRIYHLTYQRKGLRPPWYIRLKYQFYERPVYRYLQKNIGIERGHFFPTGGAAVPKTIEEFIHSVGIPMLTGYGLTETTATVTLSSLNAYEIGSVGKPLAGLEIRLSDKKEIWVRGATVMKGYYKKKEATREVLDVHGWFHTGDIGQLKNGQLFLKERLKELYKLSNGKYIAPQALEMQLLSDPLFHQLIVFADQRKYVSSLIVPNFKFLRKELTEEVLRNLPDEELVELAEVKSLVHRHLQKLQVGLSDYERVKRFRLLSLPFSLEAGELTPTFKLKRKTIYSHYSSQIEAMYGA